MTQAVEDDWDDDADFVNDVPQNGSRWRYRAGPGSGHHSYIDLKKLRDDAKKSHNDEAMKAVSKSNYGYGGKFGVENDRMDKAAVNWNHQNESSSNNRKVTTTATPCSVRNESQSSKSNETVPQPTNQHPISRHHQRQQLTPPMKKEEPASSDDESDKLELHSSQMKASIIKSSSGLNNLRAKFEACSNNSTNGLTPAQRRVIEERDRWERQRREQQNQQQQPKTIQKVKEELQKQSYTPSSIQSYPTSKSVVNNTNTRSAVTVPAAAVQAPPPPITTVVPTSNDVQTTFEQMNLNTQETGHPTELPEVDTDDEAYVQTYTAIALFDYTAAEDDELTFARGEQITEVEMIDEGWWQGVCRGKLGLFPANYVAVE